MVQIMAELLNRCTSNISLIPKWDLSLPKNHRQLIINKFYGVGPPKKNMTFSW